MDKLKMHTPDRAEQNYQKLAELFPQAVTETKDAEGKIVRAIDKDVLMQEINAEVVDGRQERYQFTWPDKRKSVVLANQPIAKTLRLDKEKSVGRDGVHGGGGKRTENIYIEGDNLDALKLLQETYLGKVKMIYIDPPYNTGNDFIYEDRFSQSADEYAENSGQTDEEGNRMVQNTESNGRYHTDWLNMIYPRLKIAKDLLSDNGVIFISIDDNEVENLKKICNEIFGEHNFEGHIHWRRRHNQPNDKTKMIALVAEHILAYAKNSKYLRTSGVGKIDITGKFSNPDNDPRGDWASKPWKSGSDQSGSRYEIISPKGIVFNEEWLGDEGTYKRLLADNRIIFPRDGAGMPRKKYFKNERKQEGQCATNWWESSQFGNNQGANDCITSLFGEKNVFSNPKPIELIRGLLQVANVKNDDIVLDFFSGSATMAHSVMKLNAENGSNIKYILVQLPENLDTSMQHASAERKKQLKVAIKFLDSCGKPHTLCEIGEERIRRAGAKIKEETGADIDYGFRCFYVDSSNMRDVYYRPSDYEQKGMDLFADNVKPDRTSEDLLFQVMLDLGIELSASIEEKEIAGKKVFSVDDGYLMACFDADVTDEVVTAIAQQHPFYAVFRDGGMGSDSVLTNFEQIFTAISPDTVRRVL